MLMRHSIAMVIQQTRGKRSAVAVNELQQFKLAID